MNTVDPACKVAAFPKPGGLGQGEPGSGVFSGNLAVVAACYLYDAYCVPRAVQFTGRGAAGFYASDSETLIGCEAA